MTDDQWQAFYDYVSPRITKEAITFDEAKWLETFGFSFPDFDVLCAKAREKLFTPIPIWDQKSANGKVLKFVLHQR